MKIKLLFIMGALSLSFYGMATTMETFLFTLRKNQDKLCIKYNGFRAGSGSACNKAVGAALAEEVCLGFRDYGESQCHKSAQTLLGGPAGQANTQNNRLTILNNSPRDACNLVAQLIPRLEADCKSIPVPSQNKPTPPVIPTPAPMASAPKPAQSTTPTKPITMPALDKDCPVITSSNLPEFKKALSSASLLQDINRMYFTFNNRNFYITPEYQNQFLHPVGTGDYGAPWGVYRVTLENQTSEGSKSRCYYKALLSSFKTKQDNELKFYITFIVK